jgi:hypothetical protein
VVFNLCASIFPRFASAVGLLWVAGRVAYQVGYGTQGPSGRGIGARLSGAAKAILVCFSVDLADFSLVVVFMDCTLNMPWLCRLVTVSYAEVCQYM